MLASPLFDSELLGSIRDAVERRGKALRYHGSLACEREVDRGAERLNVEVASVTRLRLRLTVWPDSTFSLSVVKPGPSRQGGWEIKEQVEGRLGHAMPPEIVGRIEESMLRPTDVADIWGGKRI